MARDVVIVGAARTPIGSFQGTLSSLTAPQLGAIAIKAALERAGVDPGKVEEVWMGNVLQAGQGQAPGRQASIGAGIPDTVPTNTLNKMCGSGLKTVISAAQAIALGDADVIVAGGFESMSNAPYLSLNMRNGARMGNVQMLDHMVYDGEPHQSACRYPALASRSFVISSFGKTFHVTGWKVAYCAAPAPLTAEFRKVHQFNVFTVNTPMQHGLAAFMANASNHLGLPAFYQHKRDLFRAGLAASRFTLLPSEGSYFQCVDYSAISDEPEEAFCRRLTTEAGVAAIPLSAFYQGGFEQRIVRFCFAKKDETLQLALDRLAAL